LGYVSRQCRHTDILITILHSPTGREVITMDADRSRQRRCPRQTSCDGFIKSVGLSYEYI